MLEDTAATNDDASHKRSQHSFILSQMLKVNPYPLHLFSFSIILRSSYHDLDMSNPLRYWDMIASAATVTDADSVTLTYE